jgi:hypothetical protein
LGIKKPIETIIVTKFNESKTSSFLMDLVNRVPLASRFFPAEDPIKDLEDKLRAYMSVGTKFSGDLFFVPYSKDVYAAQKKGLPVSHSNAGANIKNAYAGITEKIME